MKYFTYLFVALFAAQLCLSETINESEMETYAKAVAQKEFLIDDLVSVSNSYCSNNVEEIQNCITKIKNRINNVYSSEYVVGARYDSISITLHSESHRLYFLYLMYIKLDTTQKMIMTPPDRYCTVSTSGKYYLLDTKKQFEIFSESLFPIDSPQKAEFLAIVYAKCVKGVSHYETSNPKCTVSTVFQNNEYITTISEKVYDSYWNDFIKKEVVFKINKNGEYSLVDNSPDEKKE